MTTVAGLVLAAGAGRRMGTPKAALLVEGVPLLDRAVAVLRGAGCDPVVAVVRADTAPSDARMVVNPAPERGLRSSLRLGIDAVPEVEAVAVLLVDMPGVTVAAARAVLDAWRPGRIAIAHFSDRSGHPIVMSGPMWAEALDMAGLDDGARAYLAANPQLIDDVLVNGSGADLDTPEDLAAWRDRRG